MSVYIPPFRHLDDGLEAPRYGPTSHHSELSLLQGYGAPQPAGETDRPVEAQQCVCGGWLAPDYASEIPAAVARHNATGQHLAWRARRGIR